MANLGTAWSLCVWMLLQLVVMIISISQLILIKVIITWLVTEGTSSPVFNFPLSERVRLGRRVRMGRRQARRHAPPVVVEEGRHSNVLLPVEKTKTETETKMFYYYNCTVIVREPGVGPEFERWIFKISNGQIFFDSSKYTHAFRCCT